MRWYMTQHQIGIQVTIGSTITFLYDIAVFDLLSLTLCINCFLYSSID